MTTTRALVFLCSLVGSSISFGMWQNSFGAAMFLFWFLVLVFTVTSDIQVNTTLGSLTQDEVDYIKERRK